MSNLGMQAIYSLLNSQPDIVCERVFWEPEEKSSTLSIESQRPLSDFPLLAFSVSYELDYFNIPRILKSSGIPVYAKDRDESHPLIIAGGPCITSNPMPLAPFFDCLCIGEAEPIIPSMLPVLREGIGGKRSDLLEALAKLPGVYVPQVEQTYPIARQRALKLDDFPVHSVVLTPDTELGDLYLIEVERGCGWGCRFCMVSTAFSPMRYRSIDNLIAQAKVGLKYRKRIGLVGPAVPDHPKFEELLEKLQGTGAEISISSLRIKPLPTIALQEIAKGGARTIALAPEAGSERLRKAIRKNITESDILKAVEKVAEQKGIEQLKLYFMIGLPTETDDDIGEMIRLALAVKSSLDRRRPGIRITLSVAPFVPKAGTPFQWLPMERLPVIQSRFDRLKKELMPKGITPKAESIAWSQVQGVLARGDEKLAPVLADIEDISMSGWRKALKKHRIDADSYLYRRLDVSEKLPWSVLDSGVAPSHLMRELERAVEG